MKPPIQGLSATLHSLAGRAPEASDPGRLSEAPFTPNPGQLRAWRYQPEGIRPGAALVVALHGCGQTAAAFDAGTGWSHLADRLGFAVLLPEQLPSNNTHTCFNWFEPGDVARDRGEAGSVAAAVAGIVQEWGLDRRRVFVTGLSAGAAMAGALLACYPDVFAAGALVAGLPFGAASGAGEALDAMFRGHVHPGTVWGPRVREAAPPGFAGGWPRVTVWHGGADRVVRPVNAGETVKQWLDVHGLNGPGRTDTLAGASRTVWRDRAGRAAVEQVSVPGLGHGVPVDPGASGIGAPGPHILAAHVSSTEEIARFFGLLPSTSAPTAPEPGFLSRILRMGLDPLRLLPGPR